MNMEAGHKFSQREQRTVLLASCIGIFTMSLMGTMITLALSDIGSDFDISTHNLAWITTIYFLSSVIFILPWARASDLIGKKKVFMLGLVITIIGAALASISTDFTSLLLFRAVMGAGGAAISCTSVALISEVYPRHKRGGALGINTAVVYVGSSIGPPLGGFLTDTLGWHSTFYVIVPICLISLVTIFTFKGDFTAAKGESFDYKGSVVYGIAMVLAMFGVLNIPSWYSFICIAAGALLLLGFYIMQKREQYPILNVKVFSNPRYTRSVTVALLSYGSAYAVSFFAALYLKDVNGWSASKAGMILLIQPAIQAVFTPITGKLSDKLDGRILPTIGMFVTTLGLAVIMLFPTSVDTTMVILSLVLLGVGYALFSAPNTNAVMSSVSEKLYSEASGTLSTMRQAGMLVSMGIAAACISIFTGDMKISDDIPAFMDAMRTAFVICVAMGIAGTLLSWFRGKDSDTVIEDT